MHHVYINHVYYSNHLHAILSKYTGLSILRSWYVTINPVLMWTYFTYKFTCFSTYMRSCVYRLVYAAGSQSTHSSSASHVSAPADLDRDTVEAAYATFRSMEAPLQAQLIDCLDQKPDVTVIGPQSADTGSRVATISFVHKTKTSDELDAAIQGAGFAIRHGHMYAMRLTERLVDMQYVRSPGDGVVRISLLHYNTPEEVQQLVSALDKIL